MLNRVRCFLFAVVTTAISISVNAAVINADYLTAGDGRQFYSESRGLTYLDLGFTDNRSIDEVLGLYTGYRVATRTEVQDLFFEAFSGIGLDVDGNFYEKLRDDVNTDFSNALDSLMSVTNITYSYRSGSSTTYSSSSSSVGGYFMNEDGSFDFAWAGSSYYADYDRRCTWTGSCSYYTEYRDRTYQTVFSTNAYTDTSLRSGSLGVFLVENTASVSEPGTLALLSIGLFALCGSRIQSRRKA